MPCFSEREGWQKHSKAPLTHRAPGCKGRLPSGEHSPPPPPLPVLPTALRTPSAKKPVHSLGVCWRHSLQQSNPGFLCPQQVGGVSHSWPSSELRPTCRVNLYPHSVHSNFLTPLCLRTWTRSCSTAEKERKEFRAALQAEQLQAHAV